MIRGRSREVLLLDMDSKLRQCLEFVLSERGHLCAAMTSDSPQLNQSQARAALIYLADLERGLNRLRHLSHQPGIKMMALCASSRAEDRVQAIRNGAADAMSLPIDTDEACLRTELLIGRQGDKSEPIFSNTCLEFDGIFLDRKLMKASVNSCELSMTPIQFRLLWVLAQHMGETVSKHYLYESVLEREYSPEDRSLDMHLSRVRRKLAQVGFGAQRLHTFHGRGYRLS